MHVSRALTSTYCRPRRPFLHQRQHDPRNIATVRDERSRKRDTPADSADTTSTLCSTNLCSLAFGLCSPLCLISSRIWHGVCGIDLRGWRWRGVAVGRARSKERGQHCTMVVGEAQVSGPVGQCAAVGVWALVGGSRHEGRPLCPLQAFRLSGFPFVVGPAFGAASGFPLSVHCGLGFLSGFRLSAYPPESLQGHSPRPGVTAHE